jgi:2-polyprenyl-3-methyl-5-hydroxy-6-metoxy-1,4-benzoquinol methylase
MSEAPLPEKRRLGDAIDISGSYQHKALLDGPPVQRFWHRSKLDLLDWIFPVRNGDDVLEVGAGSGVFADAMASRGARVVAIDANDSAIDYAVSTFARPGLTFLKGYLDELRFEPQSFDKATCLEVIEHVYPDQVRALLSSLMRILRPGGRLLLTTPNYRGLWPFVEWTADRFSPAAKMDAEQHVTHFHRKRLADFVRAAGFEIEKLRTYSTFAPFTAALSWKFAERAERWEREIDLPFGNLLVTVAVKRA